VERSEEGREMIIVIPAKAGIQHLEKNVRRRRAALDASLRWYDNRREL
jgi:hypothetical protein